MLAAAQAKSRDALPRAMEHPTVSVGTPEEHAYWATRFETFLRDRGGEADARGRILARLDYAENRMTLYGLPDARDERSAADTVSHELLHALFYQLDELRAARTVDLVARPPDDPGRVGGI